MRNPHTYGYVRTDGGSLAPCHAPRHGLLAVRKTLHVIAVASDALRWMFLPIAACLIFTVPFFHVR